MIRLASDDFQENMTQMKFDWEGLKKEIYLVREGRDNGNLYFYSEAFFELADDTVHSARNCIPEKERVFSRRNINNFESSVSNTSIFLFISIPLNKKNTKKIRERGRK